MRLALCPLPRFLRFGYANVFEDFNGVFDLLRLVIRHDDADAAEGRLFTLACCNVLRRPRSDILAPRC